MSSCRNHCIRLGSVGTPEIPTFPHLADEFSLIDEPVQRYVFPSDAGDPSPPTARHRIALLRPRKVSNDNASFSGGTAVFTFSRDMQVATLDPPEGAYHGGTDVVVRGRNFLNTTTAACKFGTKIVPATYISHGAILCISPPNPVGTVWVEVSSNGQDFSLLGAPFLYYPRTSVSSVSPLVGSASRGGTSVILQGQGFEDTLELSCAFGHMTGIEANWLTSDAILCKAPVQYPGVVSLRVTLNGRDFSQEQTKFSFVDEPSVEGIQPERILGTGQVPIFVRGSNFLNTTKLSCRFGSLASKALFVSQELVSCVAPSLATKLGLCSQGKHMSVEVSLNGLDFSDSQKSIVYEINNPPGHYTTSGISLEVPNGTFSTDMVDFNFTLCKAGTFQPSSGSGRCVSCPVGLVCPGESSLPRQGGLVYKAPLC